MYSDVLVGVWVRCSGTMSYVAEASDSVRKTTGQADECVSVVVRMNSSDATASSFQLPAFTDRVFITSL